MKPLALFVTTATQLEYEVSTTPFPLQASPADAQQPLLKAALNIVASNPNVNAVAIKSIAFHFDIAPTGHENDATYLTSVAPTAGGGPALQVVIDPTLWTVTNGSGTFTATANAADGVAVSDQGLAFVIANVEPNRAVGTFTFRIRETLVDGTVSNATVQLSKFPYQFFMRDFAPDQPVVNNGDSTILRWNVSPGANLKINLGDGDLPVHAANFYPTGDLTEDTTFLLKASIGDRALATLQATVLVRQPTVDLTALTVEGISTLKGAVSAATDLTVAGKLAVPGSAALGTLGVSASLTVAGTTIANGPVNMFGTPQDSAFPTPTGKGPETHQYGAAADGFVLGSIWVDIPLLEPVSIQARVVGGDYMFDAAAQCLPAGIGKTPLPGIFLLPIRKGDAVRLQCFPPSTGGGTFLHPQFLFIPLGLGVTKGLVKHS